MTPAPGQVGPVPVRVGPIGCATLAQRGGSDHSVYAYAYIWAITDCNRSMGGPHTAQARVPGTGILRYLVMGDPHTAQAWVRPGYWPLPIVLTPSYQGLFSLLGLVYLVVFVLRADVQSLTCSPVMALVGCWGVMNKLFHCDRGCVVISEASTPLNFIGPWGWEVGWGVLMSVIIIPILIIT